VTDVKSEMSVLSPFSTAAAIRALVKSYY
jgi:hypothetical protein